MHKNKHVGVTKLSERIWRFDTFMQKRKFYQVESLHFLIRISLSHIFYALNLQFIQSMTHWCLRISNLPMSSPRRCMPELTACVSLCSSGIWLQMLSLGMPHTVCSPTRFVGFSWHPERWNLGVVQRCGRLVGCCGLTRCWEIDLLSSAVIKHLS